MNESLLIDGKIPKNTICPFRVKCDVALYGMCKHTGYNHPNSFSCALSHAYDIATHLDLKKGQSNDQYERGEKG